jgi:hypothetical protein
MLNFILIGFIFSSLSHAISGNQENSPNFKALSIAASNSRINRIHQELIQTVKNIKPTSDSVITTNLLEDTLAFLGEKGTEPFQFKILSRKEKEQEILLLLNHHLSGHKKRGFAFSYPESRIQSEKPIKTLGIFPNTQPMGILAAPGASWNGHHVYPGGLITHIASTMRINTEILKTYDVVYNLNANSDQKNLLILAAIWHDCAKAWVLNWHEDGKVTEKEGTIAGTGAHHVWSIAEALSRNYHPDFIVTLAGAHDAFTEGEESYQKGIEYLTAAAIVAGVQWSKAGLVLEKNGKFDLLNKPQLFPLINHLGDGDWIITEQAIKNVRPALDEILTKIPELSGSQTQRIRARNWKRNQLLSLQGEILPYSIFQSGGNAALKQWVNQNL